MDADCQSRWNDDYAAPRPSAGVFDSPSIPICLNTEWASHLDGLLETLLCPSHWEGDETEVEAAIQQVGELLAKLSQIEDCPTTGVTRVHYIGEVFFSWSSSVPTGCLSLHSLQTLQRSAYPDLWDALPANLKTDTTITLPPMKGRFPVGQGFDYADPGEQTETILAGMTGGEMAHTLQPGEMPTHSHTRNSSGAGERVLHNTTTGTSTFAGSGNRLALTGLTDTGVAGNSESHNNMPPFAGGYWYIQAL